MKKYSYAILTTALLLCACQRTIVQEGKKIDPEVLKEIHTDLAMEDVESLIGTPSFKTTFDGHVWYYGTRAMAQTSFLNPKLVDQSIVSITFDKEGHVSKVSSLDKTAARTIDVTLKETPAPGHHGGLFENLFGHTKHYAAEKK